MLKMMNMPLDFFLMNSLDDCIRRDNGDFSVISLGFTF